METCAISCCPSPAKPPLMPESRYSEGPEFRQDAVGNPNRVADLSQCGARYQCRSKRTALKPMRASFRLLLMVGQSSTEFFRGCVEPSDAEPAPRLLPLQRGQPLKVGTRMLAWE